MGFPEQEIVVTGTVSEVGTGGRTVEVDAAQSDNEIIRNAEAELELGALVRAQPREHLGRVAVGREHRVPDALDRAVVEQQRQPPEQRLAGRPRRSAAPAPG